MFLESITFMGNDALVPVNRIKYINTGYGNEYYRIKIISDDGDWEELFPKESEMRKRYDQIKTIIKAK